MEAKVAVVLGMHRSGTSLLANIMAELGFGMGTNLMPAASENEKGFWEDLDINQINIEVMELAAFTWDSPIQQIDWDLIEPGLRNIVEKAATILKSKMEEEPHFAFKDPRTSLLLPFWKRVFDSLGITPIYLQIVRNPIAVAHSLKKRNMLSSEEAAMLWLQYNMSMFTNTYVSKPLLIDYDQILTKPDTILKRIVNHIKIKPTPIELAKIKERVLDNDLNHAEINKFDEENFSTTAETLALKLYRLCKTSNRKRSPREQEGFNYIYDQYSELEPVFRLLQRRRFRTEVIEQIQISQTFEKTVQSNSQQLASLETERNNLISKAVTLEESVLRFAASLSEKDSTIEQMQQTVSAYQRDSSTKDTFISNLQGKILQLKEDHLSELADNREITYQLQENHKTEVSQKDSIIDTIKRELAMKSVDLELSLDTEESLKKDILSLGAELQNQNIEKDELKAEIQNQNIEKDELKAEIQNQNIERNLIEYKLEELAKDQQEFESSLELTRSNGVQLEKLIAAQEQKSLHLQQEYDALSDLNHRTHLGLQGLAGELEVLRSQHAALLNESRQLKRENHLMIRSISRLPKRVLENFSYLIPNKH
jgi:chromosome segregation ATPase